MASLIIPVQYQIFILQFKWLIFLILSSNFLIIRKFTCNPLEEIGFWLPVYVSPIKMQNINRYEAAMVKRYSLRYKLHHRSKIHLIQAAPATTPVAANPFSKAPTWPSLIAKHGQTQEATVTSEVMWCSGAIFAVPWKWSLPSGTGCTKREAQHNPWPERAKAARSNCSRVKLYLMLPQNRRGSSHSTRRISLAVLQASCWMRLCSVKLCSNKQKKAHTLTL